MQTSGSKSYISVPKVAVAPLLGSAAGFRDSSELLALSSRSLRLRLVKKRLASLPISSS